MVRLAIHMQKFILLQIQDGFAVALEAKLELEIQFPEETSHILPQSQSNQLHITRKGKTFFSRLNAEIDTCITLMLSL